MSDSLFTRPGTKRYSIAALHANGLTTAEAYDVLKPKVSAQVKPWIFTTNTDNGRIPKPLSLQYAELQFEINRVYKVLNSDGNPLPEGIDIDSNEIPAPDENDAAENVEIDEDESEIEESPKPPKAKGKTDKDSEKRHFMNEWRRIRKWIADTSATTGAIPVDSLDSMRPVESAKAMIESGISAATMLYAMTLHWPQATRDMAGIQTVDFLGLVPPISPEHHAMSGYVLKLVENRQNVMLIGSAGTGKSTCIKQVADHLGVRYGETPMTPGATRGDLLGRHTLDGFIPSQFVEIYSQGGIFNFEEIDASDPSMLIVVNNALASNHLYNSVNGEVYERSPNFVATATGNTFGLGADSKYTGREKLDLATIDRFRMGRAILNLDEALADRIMGL